MGVRSSRSVSKRQDSLERLPKLDCKDCQAILLVLSEGMGRIGGWHVRHHATIVIRIPTRMEDVLLGILKFLEFVLALLGHDWRGH